MEANQHIVSDLTTRKSKLCEQAEILAAVYNANTPSTLYTQYKAELARESELSAKIGTQEGMLQEKNGLALILGEKRENLRTGLAEVKKKLVATYVSRLDRLHRISGEKEAEREAK